TARMQAVLPACVAQGTRIITNMGAANPEGAGQAVLEVARALGLHGLRVAVVTGDDVLDWVRAQQPALLDGGPPWSALQQQLVSANAYLGADALLPALASGAEVVLCGRVADPALFLAPLMHHFGWAADDWSRLGQGIVVGHLLECAAQVSGGYIADPGAFDVPGLHDVGFPFAEVDADGAAVITKLAGTGGRVDRLTCTAQLLYEIEDPARYIQPDVVADFSAVRLHELGPDRVAVSGGAGRLRPDALKATLGYRDGFIGEGQISYAGPGAQARGELALDILQHRLVRAGLDGLERRAELVGVNAMHGGGAPRHGAAQVPAEVRVRLALRCTSRAQAEWVGHEVEALYLNGPAAGGGVNTSVREVVAAASVLVPRAVVQTQYRVLVA
ncbi:MAG: acyclic terpene utilization AtuA family protein, partial [Rubrivivax sp.]|nr:acyclic terpene utilization AtuA family protein [Rubrivivax sp.]